jgi:hypothetical protein
VRVVKEGLKVDLISCHLKSKLLSFPRPLGTRFTPRNEGERAGRGHRSYEEDGRGGDFAHAGELVAGERQCGTPDRARGPERTGVAMWSDGEWVERSAARVGRGRARVPGGFESFP